jgi:hypothetical protein
MAVKNFLRSAIDRASGVVKKQLLLLWSHLPEEIARLFPVIVYDAVVIVIRVTISASGRSAYCGWLSHNPWLFGL